MSLCPEAERRDAMSDGEFWAWVFNLAPDTEEELDHDDRRVLVGDLTPCAECGELGPCAYDDHGRALVHVVPEEEA